MGRLIRPGDGKLVPGPGHQMMASGARMVAGHLNRMFAEVNQQVGRLAANGNVVVGYVVGGFSPAVEQPGGLSVSIHWFTAEPRCLHAVESGPCAQPATWARKPEADEAPVYLCEEHAALVDADSRTLIADIVAAIQPKKPEGTGETECPGGAGA